MRLLKAQMPAREVEDSMAVGDPTPRPEDRRIIVVVNEVMRGQLEMARGGKDVLLGDGIWVVVLGDDLDSELYRKLSARGLLRSGAVLIQSPWSSDAYEDVANAAETFAVEKFMQFSLYCMLLGASRVEIRRVERTSSEGRIAIEVSSGGVLQQGAAGFSDQRLQQFCRHISLVDEFSGEGCDLPAAEALLGSGGLSDDGAVRSLVSFRRAGRNRLLRRELRLSAAASAQRTLHAAMTMMASPAFLLACAGAYGTLDDSEYTLDVLATFPPCTDSATEHG
jgi:hypothetical protein